MSKRGQVLRDAQGLAALLGLEVYSYSPGDGRKYRVSTPGRDFFSAPRALTFLTPAEVLAYLRGVQDAADLKKQAAEFPDVWDYQT
jgi:hypothetical protein